MPRYGIWIVVLASLRALHAFAAEPCPLVADAEQAVTVELTEHESDAVLVAGVTLVVDHPETKVGLVGESIAVPKGVITGAPPDAIATANDLGDAVRLVVARPGPLPVGTPLLTLHFQRCRGASPAGAAEFRCTVADAADPSANKIPQGLGCRVVVP